MATQTSGSGTDSLRLDGRAIQTALRHLGYDPGAIDGVIGPRTLAAFGQWAGDQEVADSVYLVPSEDNRAAEVSPAAAARALLTAATTAARAAPRTSTATVLEPLPPGERTLLTTSQPFWRASNPWAWGVVIGGVTAVTAGLFWWGVRGSRLSGLSGIGGGWERSRLLPGEQVPDFVVREVRKALPRVKREEIIEALALAATDDAWRWSEVGQSRVIGAVRANLPMVRQALRVGHY